jgi:hypothetical protein
MAYDRFAAADANLNLQVDRDFTRTGFSLTVSLVLPLRSSSLPNFFYPLHVQVVTPGTGHFRVNKQFVLASFFPPLMNLPLSR